MNGHSISHWGIFLSPDTEHVANVLFQDGCISNLDVDEFTRFGDSIFSISLEPSVSFKLSPVQWRFEKQSVWPSRHWYRLSR